MSNLKLNFDLQTVEERQKFISTIDLSKLSRTDIETVSNYLLWGKTAEGVALGEGIDIETRNKTWSRKPVDSLDALLENPNFNDSTVHPLGEGAPAKVSKTPFSREEARNAAPEPLQDVFENLWIQIDTIDLSINYYEINIGKRSMPPRDELLNRFSPKRQTEIQADAIKMSPYTYLKKRHELSALRNQQYTLRDSYIQPPIQPSHFAKRNTDTTITFDADIPVYPLGVVGSTGASNTVFSNLDPAALTQPQLDELSRYYWTKTAELPDCRIDFRRDKDVYELLNAYTELRNSYNESLDNNTDNLLQTLDYYIDLANLTQLQHDILVLKIHKQRNQDIATYINTKYAKNYTTNYISTIFCQKIIPRICEAAVYHVDAVGNLFFPENFKKCTKCGKVLLLDKRNFVRKTRSSDGFNSKCKCCERDERKKRS